MKTYKYFIISCLALGMASCTDDEQANELGDASAAIKQISATVADYGAVTRSELYRENDAINFRWSVGDTLGIYPDEGAQAYFKIEKSQAGKLTATFDGGGWGLKSSHTYVAYSPYINNINLDKEAIPLDYTGQIQVGNNTYSHLGKYDYLASDQVVPEGNNLNFTMNHLGSILLLQLTVPEAGDFTYCTVSADREVFTTLATMDVSGNSPKTTSVEKAKKISLELNDVKTNGANETLTLAMMVYPVDLISNSIKVSLYERGGNVYSGNVEEPKNLEKGKPYLMTASLAFEKVDSHGIISFADNAVKNICVKNWDLDGDGELSFYEAAEIVSIDTEFSNNSSIRSFDEFQYFTGVKYLMANTFAKSSIKSIKLPPTIKNINSQAFLNCSSLTDITFSESLASIGYQAFSGCTSLTKVTVPNHVTVVGAEAFYGCTNLTNVSLPEGITTISSKTFTNCSSLVKVNIPSTVTTISEYAFQNCASLRTITIPSSLTVIGTYAFERCSKLTSIIIPNSVTQIGTYAFQNCTNLVEIKLPDELTVIPDYMLYNCTNLMEIVIPSSVKTIGSYALRYCSSLLEIVIPENVTFIGKYAFGDCTNLTEIKCYAVNPPRLGNYSFDNTNNCPLFVPSSSIDQYKSDSYWNGYKNRIFPLEE